VILTVHLR